jgi:hypothetical protein
MGQRRTEVDRGGQRLTDADRGGQRRTEADRGGQRRTEADSGGQRRTEADSGGQRRTEADRGGQWRTVADIWQTCGGHMVDMWRTYGRHVADIWRTCGGQRMYYILRYIFMHDKCMRLKLVNEVCVGIFRPCLLLRKAFFQKQKKSELLQNVLIGLLGTKLGIFSSAIIPS